MVLHVDLAPTHPGAVRGRADENIHGKSWKKLVQGDSPAGASSWFYEYNYEKQFPYTPNIRGVRTDDWVYIHYPHGDATRSPQGRLYNLKTDPDELKNLIDDPAQAARVAGMRQELARLILAAGLTEDRMPLDEGIKQTLPDLKIR